MYSMTPDAVHGSGKPDADCIRCARCSEVCPEKAIDTYLVGSSVKVNRYFIPAITVAALGWYTWFFVLIANRITQLF
jgi:ferredoxin